MSFDIRGLGERGFTLLEIMIVVAICAVLVAVAVPAYSNARATAQRKACVVNLRQIDGAKQVWAIEQRKSEGSAVKQKDILPYLSHQRMPTCPANGVYSVRVVGRNPTCTRARIGHALSNLDLDADPEPD